jgi:glycosyltransferase involved in cell wall biosynthesis
VNLGIFGTTAKALNVVPTKVFQGAAAGCAVVTSDTPPQRAALGDAAVYVPPGDVAGLVAALRALAKDRSEVRRLGRTAYAVAQARFTPAAVVAPIRAALAAGATDEDQLETGHGQVDDGQEHPAQ